MSFSSKRLRVRLPCGEQTVLDAGQQTATRGCDWRFATELGTERIAAEAGCEWPMSGVICNGIVDSVAACVEVFSMPTCDFTREYPPPGGFCTPVTVEPQRDPGAVLVDPDDLPRLRAQLERTLEEVQAQLREIDDAQEQLKRR